MPLGTSPHTFRHKCKFEISLLNIPVLSPLELTTMCSLAGPSNCCRVQELLVMTFITFGATEQDDNITQIGNYL